MRYWYLLLPIAFAFSALLLLFTGMKVGWSVMGFSPRWRIPAKAAAFFLAFLFSGLALSGIKYERPVTAGTYIFCFDVTYSQAVEDYFEGDKPVSRLRAAKNFVREAVSDLPPHSYVAFCAYSGADEGSFALLLPPISNEREYSIEKALDLADWRHAWKDGSSLAPAPSELYGLFKNFEGPFNIVILGDGESDTQFDPQITRDDVAQFVSKSRFLLIGVGKSDPSVVPKFNEEGKKIGCLSLRFTDKCFTSRLDEGNMKKAAEVLKGEFLRIEEKEAIKAWLDKPVARKGEYSESVSYDWVFGLGALLFFVLWILI